jgi:hypothetical protein
MVGWSGSNLQNSINMQLTCAFDVLAPRAALPSLCSGQAYLQSSVVNLTPLYINSEVVIPAKAGIQLRKTGFRVKPGMTNKEKEFMTHYTSG